MFFPRAPVEDLKPPSGGTLGGDFGGFELSGSVVVPNREVFDWVRAHPGESVAFILERMRSGTTWID